MVVEGEREEGGVQVEWKAWEAVRSVERSTRYTAALPHVTCRHTHTHTHHTYRSNPSHAIYSVSLL